MQRQRSRVPDTPALQNETEEPRFRIGQSIRMSTLGATRCPRLAKKTGKIFGSTNYSSSVAVVFKGNRTPTSIHIDYIELIDDCWPRNQ
jgi:hypothetical protein